MFTFSVSQDNEIKFINICYEIRILCTYAAAKSLQLCPTLCDPIDGSPPGSPVPGVLQARTLEWVAIAFSIGTYEVVIIVNTL